MKKYLLAIAALALLALGSCTKEEDDADIDVSKSVYLVDGYWRMTSFLVNNDIDNEFSPTTETFEFLDGCIKDNVYTFNSKSSLTINEDRLKCNVNSPDEQQYYYSITEGDSYIKIWSNPDNPDASIFMDGTIETISVKKFTISKKYWNATTEKNVYRQTTYEMFLEKK